MKTKQHCASMGWTLVEIMIVVAIMGILLGLAVPKVIRAHNNAKIAQATADLERIASAVEELAWDTGLWPGGVTRLDKGTKKPLGYLGTYTNEILDLGTPDAGLIYEGQYFTNTGWKGPYIHKLPLDPWGNKYFFDSDYMPLKTGQSVVVIGSFGPNGKGINVYDGDDIYVKVRTRDSTGE